MDDKFQKILEHASDLVEDEEYEEAMLLYDKVLGSDPKNIPALLDRLQPCNEWKKIHNPSRFTILS